MAHSNSFRFQVALSFPGEHRPRVEEIALSLAAKLGQASVLYDRWYSEEFARPNLNVYLPKLYHEQSLLLVFFLSEEYSQKEWCGLEWRAGLDLIKRKEDDRVMLLRLDDSNIPGLYSIDGFLDISKISDEEVAQRILRRLAGEIEKMVPPLRGHARPDIQNRCGTIRILTMEQPTELGGIYTDVNVLEKRPANIRKSRDQLIKEAKPGKFDRFGIAAEPIKRVSGLRALAHHQRLMIYGKPGSGKTTFLKRLAMECANGNFRAELVPIFITLKDFAESAAAPTLFEHIQQQWDGNPNAQSVLKGGRALVLLDGLDEVRDQDFVRVRKVIEAFTNEYHSCPIVMTCRIAAREYTFELFTEVEMADFSKAQIETFAERWFTVQGEKKRVRAFMRKLQANRPVFELASSPLLLTLLCLIFQERNDFEGTRAELYREGLEVLLRKWDAKRGIERDRPYGLTITNMETLLSEIAFSRFKAAEYFFDQDGLEQQIDSFFKERKLLKPDQELIPTSVLNSIESHLGLLVQRAVRVYSFSHLTFQEYLSALRIARKRTLLTQISPYVGDRRWREIWLSLVTMLDEDDFIVELKKYVDGLVQRHEKTQRYLEWSRQRAANENTNYRPQSLRAFFFGLDIAVVHFPSFDFLTPGRDLSRLTFRLDSDRELDRSLDRDLQRSLALPIALDPKFSLATDRRLLLYAVLAQSLALASAVDTVLSRTVDENFKLASANDLAGYYSRAFVRSVARAAEIASAVSPVLCLHLRALPAKALTAPTKDGELLKWRAQSRTEWSRLHSTCREVITHCCGVGHDWGFSLAESMLLREYHRANTLLVECMQAARGLTNKVRQQTNDNMLMPHRRLANRNKRNKLAQDLPKRDDPPI